MESFFDDDCEHLFDVISKINNKQECFDFFIDLCTIKEIKEMSKRFKSAEMLFLGHNYNEVIKETSISSATLARVNRCLQYGSGGYKKQISKNKKEKKL